MIATIEERAVRPGLPLHLFRRARDRWEQKIVGMVGSTPDFGRDCGVVSRRPLDSAIMRWWKKWEESGIAVPESES